MKKRIYKKISAAIVAAGMLCGGPSSSFAYLSPSNTAVNTADSTQIQYMDASYLDDHYTPAAAGYTVGPGSIPDYLTTPNWAYSPPLRKFIDTLPGLGAANANNLGQYIPVAVPDIVTYPGTDYYEIELREYREQQHSDLPASPTVADYAGVTTSGTTMRGYMQINKGTDTTGGCTDPVLGGGGACDASDNTTVVQTKPHHLGPLIIAQKDRPVRVKFINKLPTGSGGNLFIPVDTSIMGAGPFEIDYDPVTKESAPLTTGDFTQNRALLHLHGGRTPWISDGTPHQWITPAGETTDYPTGVSVQNVPDMPDPGAGANTYYWTNQQSSRMMFYHDHAWGITRLNVYVGMAAGYIIRDDTEQALIDNGIIPSGAQEIPLVLEDRTYVDASEIASTDPTWAWGTQPWDGTPGAAMTPVEGDLWWPHVYMPAQNPFDLTGIAPMGRWAYGPYFWPPTNNLFQPIPNPYYDANCSADPAPTNATTPGYLDGFCQPPEIPSSPNASWGAEAFMDTTTVNGTAYPVLEIDPKAYRFRILNAAHDRFYNLHMYIADDNPPAPANTPEFPPNLADFSATGYDGSFANSLASLTEVRMLPATPNNAALSIAPPGGPNSGGALARPATWPADGREGGIPDWSWAGPSWIMIGSEGGFLPQPVVIPPHPLDWNVDVTTFNAGNVNAGSLILGPAERADVVVDFSQYAGQTLILYNDAPAPWPALDPHYDYYTDSPDNREMGGHDTTPIGFGPNTRTIMQIKVSNNAADPAYDLAALQAEFGPTTTTVTTNGVFRDAQDPIIAGQGNMNPTGDSAYYEAFIHDGVQHDAYNNMYNATFPTAYPYWGVAQIHQTQISYYNPSTAAFETKDMYFKAIQDEQGETFDEFGRMRAGLGLTVSNPGAGQVNFVLQSFSDPATEILNEDEIQIWRITHNGVDTHPVHFHLYDVQVLNRVGWDGFLRLPDPTELGWKDTVRISPLEDTIVALKPVTPKLPFGVPESYRPLNPATPLDDPTHLSTVDPVTGQAWATPNLNRMINFDWEYVWHCHILSHEENDMMRPQSFLFTEAASSAPTLTGLTDGAVLTWTDPTPPGDLTDLAGNTTLGNAQNEINFSIERCNGTCDSNDTFNEVGTALANATTYQDGTASPSSTYSYRVVAYNADGDSTPSNIMTTTTGTFTPPTVSITSPANGANFNFGDAVNITASASAAGALTITQVEFYVDGVLFNTDTTAPYAYNWTNATAGTYSLTARAYDSDGISSGSAAVSITVVPTSPPTLTSLTPPSLTGPHSASQPFVLVYDDANGFSDLSTIDFLANSNVSFTNGISLRYTRATNTLSLHNDAGNAVSSCTPGGAGTLTNSQGSVDCINSSAVGSGTSLTLTLAITPNVSLTSTNQRLYTRAQDVGGLKANWAWVGFWSIRDYAPTFSGSTPMSTSSTGGTSQSFDLVYSDANGFADLQTIDFLINSSVSFANGLSLRYTRATNTLSMHNDAGIATSSCILGIAGTLTNTQGSINCATSSGTGNGTTLTLSLNVTPSVAFETIGSATKRLYVRAQDNQGLNLAWTQFGFWALHSNPVAPVLDRVTPNYTTSSVGTPQTFRVYFSDANGYANIQRVDFIANASVSFANGISLRYTRANNTLSIHNDAGNATSSCTLGGAGTLSNTQGSINCATSSANGVSNTLTLNLDITPSASFSSPPVKKLYTRAMDNEGLRTNWAQVGAWTINP